MTEVEMMVKPSSVKGKMKRTFQKDRIIKCLLFALDLHKSQKDAYKLENYAMQDEIVAMRAKLSKQYEEDNESMKREIQGLKENIREKDKEMREYKISFDDMKIKNESLITKIKSVTAETEKLEASLEYTKNVLKNLQDAADPNLMKPAPSAFPAVDLDLPVSVLVEDWKEYRSTLSILGKPNFVSCMLSNFPCCQAKATIKPAAVEHQELLELHPALRKAPRDRGDVTQ